MRMQLMLLAGLVAFPGVVAAQSGQSTARAVAMGRSLTAAARGYEAIVWNPALLGMPDRPGFSLNVVQAGVGGRSNVLGPTELWDYYRSDSLSAADKERILASIRATDDSTFGIGALADVMGIAVTFRNFGIALTGTAADADFNLSDDAVELALFGNVTRRAPGERYLAAGTRGAGVSAATLAVAWGQAIPVPVGHLAVGATAKFTRGILAGRASDLGSYVENAPSFETLAAGHAVFFDPDVSTNNGFGFGLDLGAAYELASGIRVAAAVENLFGSMSWKDEKLRYVRQEYLLRQSANDYQDTTIADIDGPYDPTDAVQKALRDSLLGGNPFATKLRVGAQLAAGPVLLSGDARFELADGIVPGPKQRVSVGAELPVTVLRFRAGLATDFDGGVAFSGGLGFKLGPVRLDFAAATTPGGDRKSLVVATGIGIMN